ncbi:MAG: hypothetical protein ACMUEL_03045 [Flavobacteriales bacterium Tduv]
MNPLLKKINKELEKYQAIFKTGVIVDSSITVTPFFPKETPPYVVGDRKEEAKANQSKKSNGKKRDSIRSKHSRKMPHETRVTLLCRQEAYRGGNGTILVVHSVAANEYDSRGKALIT